jgi:multidrug transporter EmrE-like cation transporter
LETTGAGQAALTTYLLLAASMLLNALANFTIKLAVRGEELDLAPAHLGATLKTLAADPVLWCGLALFGLAFVGYTLVLSRLNLSTAYPAMAGGGFLLVFFLSALYLKEAVTGAHLGGAFLIILGMWLLLR